MEGKYKILEERDNQLKLDKDLVEVQKTIIHFGNEILQKLTEIQEILKKDNVPKIENSNPILEHLLQIKIPPGYGGNNLKW